MSDSQLFSPALNLYTSFQPSPMLNTSYHSHYDIQTQQNTSKQMDQKEINKIKNQYGYVYYNTPINWSEFGKGPGEPEQHHMFNQEYQSPTTSHYTTQPQYEQGYELMPKRRTTSNHKRIGIPWTDYENRLLTQLVCQYQTKNWRLISEIFNQSEGVQTHRTAEQCSQHFLRVLNPHITKGKWSNDEDKLLVQAVKRCAPRNWKQVADLMPGRTDIQIRYRLNRLKQQLILKKQLPPEYLP